MKTNHRRGEDTRRFRTDHHFHNTYIKNLKDSGNVQRRREDRSSSEDQS